jgi:hypothetical protein
MVLVTVLLTDACDADGAGAVRADAGDDAGSDTILE